MRRLVTIGLLLVVISRVRAQQQTVEQPTGHDVTEEEPHPYTISFFLFPRQKTVNQPHSKKADVAKNDEADHSASGEAAPEDDPDASYQHGSTKHPAHEMFPTCHQCAKNSTYEECVNKKTALKCDKGLANICFTRSNKRDNIVHYEMGCATHRQCQRARSTPCRAGTKRCFTCCQWSGCNSRPHHGEEGVEFSSLSRAHSTTSTGWTAVVLISFLPVIWTLLL